MLDYHRSWLWAHPDRSEKWLWERLRDGFQIHHADGDHSNNLAENLILIEGMDHAKLHGTCLAKIIMAKASLSRQRTPRADDLVYGEVCYSARCSGLKWKHIGKPYSDGTAQIAAKNYALANGRQWPIVLRSAIGDNPQ